MQQEITQGGATTIMDSLDEFLLRNRKLLEDMKNRVKQAETVSVKIEQVKPFPIKSKPAEETPKSVSSRESGFNSEINALFNDKELEYLINNIPKHQNPASDHPAPATIDEILKRADEKPYSGMESKADTENENNNQTQINCNIYSNTDKNAVIEDTHITAKEPDINDTRSKLMGIEKSESPSFYSEFDIFAESQIESRAPTVITDKQMKALSRRHLLMMLRDSEARLAQVEEENKKLRKAFIAGFTQGKRAE